MGDQAAMLYAQAAGELTALGPDLANTAPPRIRYATMQARLGRLDGRDWRAVRDGSDALARTIQRQARVTTGDQAVVTIPPILLDGALDVAWAQAHPARAGVK